MTDAEALIRAVLDSPEDDTVRLVYADWLDERAQPGDSVRAEFIRLQIEIAKIQKDCLCGSCVNLRGGGQHHNGPCGIDGRDYGGGQHYRRKRQYELFEAIGLSAEVDSRLFNSVYEVFPQQTPDGPYVVWRRGFADKVIGTRRQLAGEYACGKCEQYAGRGRVPGDTNLRNSIWLPCDWCDGTGYDDPADGVIDLYRSQPITDVQFTDLIPRYHARYKQYDLVPVGDFPLDEDAESIPDAIWDAMDDDALLNTFHGKYNFQLVTSSFDFPTAKLAVDAARAALLIYIRSLRKTDG